MNTKRILIRSVGWLSVVALLLPAGCVKRDLEMRPVLPPAPKKGYAEIALDWGTAVPAKTVRFLFYDQAGTLVQESKGLTNGFRDSIPVGKYRIIVHSEDSRQVDYRGTESYQTAEVVAQETQNTYQHAGASYAATSRNPDIPLILEPLSVFGSGQFNEFETMEITVGKLTSATVSPKSLTRNVEFHFVVKSDVGVQTFTGVLSGVAPSIFLSTGKHNTASSCAIEFTAVPMAKIADKEYTAQMSVFNLLTTDQSPEGTNTLDVALDLADGRKFQLQVDLTAALKKIIDENGGEIPIEIPVEVILTVVGVQLTATVTPWDQSGTGGGDPRPQTIKQ